MTESRELRFPYSDVTVIVARCKYCDGETTVNLADVDKHQQILGRLLMCGVCHTEFPPVVSTALGDFANWLRHVRDSGADVSLRVTLTEAAPR